MPKVFSLRNPRFDSHNSGIHDLYVDDVRVFLGVPYREAFDFCLLYMADNDLYLEHERHMETGAQLRQGHAKRERFYQTRAEEEKSDRVAKYYYAPTRYMRIRLATILFLAKTLRRLR